jgi:hypothetical protein
MLNRVKSRRPAEVAAAAAMNSQVDDLAIAAAPVPVPVPVPIPVPVPVAVSEVPAPPASIKAPDFDRVKSRRLDDFAPSAAMSAQISALESAPAPQLVPVPVAVSEVPAPLATVKAPGFDRVKSRRLDDFAPSAAMSAQIAALNTEAAPQPAAVSEGPAPLTAVKKPGFDRVKSRRLDDFVPDGAFVAPELLNTDKSSSSVELINSPLMGASSSSSSAASTVTSFSFTEMFQRKVAGHAAPATTIEFSFAKKGTAGTGIGNKRDDGYEPVFVVDSGTATDDMATGSGASGGQNAPLRLATIISWWSSTVASCHSCLADSPAYQRCAAACAAVDADMTWLNARGALGFEDDSLLVHDAQGWLAWCVAFSLVTLRGIGQVRLAVK